MGESEARIESEAMIRFNAISVSIKARPIEVWEFIADLNNWRLFSDFAKDIERISDTEWVAHTSQGDVKVIPKFNKEHLLLDHVCILPSGEEQFIPYRVIQTSEGSELMMTNKQTASVCDQDYKEQLQWMDDELNSVKKIIETRTA